MNYVIELLQNDRDKFEPLIEISKLMSVQDFELRSLNTLRKLFTENSNAVISMDKIKTEVSAIS